MSSDRKEEIKNWAVYFLSAMAAVFIHETGHCIPAWLHGYPAVPTPAMEYILHPVTVEQNQWISLGGYIGTVGEGSNASIIRSYIKKQGKKGDQLRLVDFA